MAEPIIPIERIQREAREAARRYTSLADACPYPFGTDAAHTFKAAFTQERALIEAAQAAAPDLEP